MELRISQLKLVAAVVLVPWCFGLAARPAQSGQQPDSPTWQEHFVAAQTAQKNQDYATAEKEYRSVLTLRPAFAEAHMNLGLIFQLQARTTEAMSEFRIALRLKPTLAGANFFLGVDYCQLGEGKEAIPYLKAASRAEPNRVDIWSWLATAQEMAGDVPAEIATLHKALTLQPQNVDLLYLLGHGYERMGKDQVDALEKAAPGSARAEQLLGESYSASSEWPSAVLRFQNALAASEKTSGVHLELGEVLLRQGKLKRATEEFEEELKLYPASVRALVRRGEARLAQGDVEGALEDWTRTMEIDEERAERILGIRETGFGDAAFEQLPEELREKIEGFATELQSRNTPASHFALAFLAAQRGDTAVASQQIAEVHSLVVSSIREKRPCTEVGVHRLLDTERFSEAKVCVLRILKPTSTAELRMQVARSLFEAGDYEGSLRVLSQLPPSVRDSAEAAYWRARGYEKMATALYLELYDADKDSYRVHQLLGDLAAARNDDAKTIEEYQAAIARRPSLPNLHYSLGHVFWKDLKVKETRSEFEAELKINPRHPGALNELGDTYLLEHQADKALPYLTQAVDLEPHNPDFHRDMGTAYSELHEFEKSATEYQLAISGDHDGSVHYKLARVYQALGQKDKAAHEFALSTAMNEESHKRLEKQTERLDQIDKWTRE
jgi:tetratricopeptide (TPR) repeat protein